MKHSSELGILIITRHRLDLLKRCLESLTHTQYKSYEIYIAINGSDPKTVDWINHHSDKTRIHVIQFQNALTPAEARNEVLKHVYTEWIYFIDDDAFVEPDFFKIFEKLKMDYPQATVFGGPNLTPPNSNDFQVATGLVLSTRFAAYLSAARYKKSGLPRQTGEEQLILCNIFARRNIISENPFPRELVCCEENWWLQELQKEKQNIIYSPQLFVWHERRENFSQLVRQVFKYGTGRGQNIVKKPGSLKFPHVLPSLCLIYSLIFIPLTIQNPNFSVFILVPYITYTVLCLTLSAIVSINLKLWPLCLVLYPTIHLSYAAGVIRGIFKK